MTVSQNNELMAHVASVSTFRAAVGALIRNGAGDVLVVHPVYKDTWEIPGGMVEKDESLLAALERELKEELGLAVPARLACVDWVRPSPPWGAGLMFVFDCGVLTPQQIGEFRLPPEELDQFKFVPPADLEKVLVLPLALRLRAALSAVESGTVFYAENGEVVAA